MALRAVPDHPKFAGLKARLSIGRMQALGALECLWHFCGRFTPQGNIGKYTDAQIEAWMEWDGEPGALIAALIAERWVDEDPTHRLVVHDWHIHADKATKNSLVRTKQDFITKRTDAVRTPYPLPVPEPDPVPEPEPEPVKVSEANASSPRKDSGKPDPVEAIYEAYPRKVGKQAALRAIGRALKRLWDAGMAKREAEVFLFKRTHAYARSPAGNDGEFTPHPATWFNQGRYDDDPQEWQRKANERGTSYGNSNQGRGGITGDEMSRILDSLGGSETGDPIRGDEGALFSPA